MGILALIGMGSNLGDREGRLVAAVDALSAVPGVDVLAISPRHESVPVGGPSGQGAFLNAAAAIETTLDPWALLGTLHDIEGAGGRVRAEHWGERTLDLDLILFGDAVIDTPTLHIPHPRMALRRFVLRPLAEIAPEALDPLTGRTMAELLANLDRRPSCVALCGPSSSELSRRLARTLPANGLFADLDWDGLLERKVVELDRERWSAEVQGDRWIVTNFWFDLIDREALDRIDEAARDAWRAWFLQARAKVLQPTFVAVTNESTTARLRLWLDRDRSHPPIGREVPILRTSLDAIDAGSPSNREELDRIEAEILAACAATRAG